MRDGWVGNVELQQLVNRGDPAAEVLVEAVKVIRVDVKDLRSDWNGADSTSGLAVANDGSVRLAAGSSTVSSQTSEDGTQITDLDHASPLNALLLEWSGSANGDLTIENVVLRLDADAADTGREVEEWRCALYRVTAVGPKFKDVELTQISRVVRVAASGTVPANITFGFLVDQRGVEVGDPPVVHDYASGRPSDIGPLTRAQTVIRVWAVKGDGEPAANAAWLVDSAQAAAFGSGWVATPKVLTSITDAVLATQQHTWVDGLVGTPYFVINKPTFTAATITFTNNDIDLGAVPTANVEVVALGSTPSDSSITYQIREPAGTWYDCVDGDLVGADNTPGGGKDLSALSKVQSYEVRATLTPSSSGHDTPTISQFGVREITSTLLPATIATVEGLSYAIDPITLSSEVTEAVIRIKKDGEKDYRDIGSELLSQNDPDDLLFRIWIGHETDLARRYWLLLDVLLIDDYDSDDTEHTLLCVSPLKRLQVPIPEFVETGGGSGTRTVKVFENETGKSVWDDIIDTLIELQVRYRGPGLESTAYSLSKRISDSDGKTELDAVARNFGGSNISSQGRVKYVQVLADDDGGRTPVEVIPLSDLTPIKVGAGLRNVLDEYFVPWNWDDDRQEFLTEARAFNPTAAGAFGGPGLDAVKRHDDEAAKYIVDQAHADAIGKQVVEARGNGLRLWRVAPSTPRPHLEPGDWVVASVENYVGRDPQSGLEIGGPVSGHGVLVEVIGAWGTELLIWVRKITDLISSDGTVTRDGFLTPGLDGVFDVALIPVMQASSRRHEFEYNFRWEDDVDEAEVRLSWEEPGPTVITLVKVLSQSGDGVARVEENLSSTIAKIPEDATDLLFSIKGRNSAAPAKWGKTFSWRLDDMADATAGVRTSDGTNEYLSKRSLVGRGLSLALVAGEPQIRLETDVSGAGSKSSNFTLDAEDGLIQSVSISASVDLTNISNLIGAEPFLLRISAAANTLTLDGTNFEGPKLTFTGTAAISFVDFGTGKITAMGGDW